MRGRRGNGHHQHNGSGSAGHSASGNHGGSTHSTGGQHRRVNPRIQTFDSNGPEVRIRGNAFQINEKYLTLARDAQSAGDRVLAESYLQHAEHYQRFINEMNEEFARHNPVGYQQQQQQQPVIDASSAQPAEGLNDLDQGFLVGPRSTPPMQEAQPQPESVEHVQPRRSFSRHTEPESM